MSTPVAADGLPYTGIGIGTIVLGIVGIVASVLGALGIVAVKKHKQGEYADLTGGS